MFINKYFFASFGIAFAAVIIPAAVITHGVSTWTH